LLWPSGSEATGEPRSHDQTGRAGESVWSKWKCDQMMALTSSRGIPFSKRMSETLCGECSFQPLLAVLVQRSANVGARLWQSDRMNRSHGCVMRKEYEGTARRS
jgi:hypothetical protein